jgi:TetR/AcrR family tetracycline transcriptional repressor
MAPPRLSKDRILAAALEIAEAEGIDALSMRRLAQALDVWPMTIYGHFRDKDALLDAMAARSAGPVRRPRPGGSWQAQLTALLRDAQAGLAASAEMGARLPRAFLTPEPLALSDAAMAILRDAGFSTAEAASAWRALWSYTFGFATFRLAPTAEEAARRMRGAIASLPEADYPALAAAADDLPAAFADDAEFDFGLDRLLDGLAARLTPAA